MPAITVDIPDDLAANFDTPEAIRQALFEDFVIEQRQRGAISLGKAAELLGISYPEVLPQADSVPESAVGYKLAHFARPAGALRLLPETTRSISESTALTHELRPGLAPSTSPPYQRLIGRGRPDAQGGPI